MRSSTPSTGTSRSTRANRARLAESSAARSKVKGATKTAKAFGHSVGLAQDELSSEHGVDLDLVAEFLLQRCPSFSTVIVEGGPQIAWAPLSNGMTPYVQVVAGLEHSFGETAFTFAPGGGVRIPVNSYTVLVEAEYRRSLYDGFSGSGFGFSVGVVLPLGR